VHFGALACFASFEAMRAGSFEEKKKKKYAGRNRASLDTAAGGDRSHEQAEGRNMEKGSPETSGSLPIGFEAKDQEVSEIAGGKQSHSARKAPYTMGKQEKGRSVEVGFGARPWSHSKAGREFPVSGGPMDGEVIVARRRGFEGSLSLRGGAGRGCAAAGR